MVESAEALDELDGGPSIEEVALEVSLGALPFRSGANLASARQIIPTLGISTRPGLKQLKSVHQIMAQMRAAGRDNETIAASTGYSLSYISTLNSDPAFADLVEYYKGDRKVAFIENTKLEAQLDKNVLEELQGRLEDTPEKFSIKDLTELHKTLKPAAPQGGGGGFGPSVVVPLQVNFVTKRSGSGPVEDEVIDANYRLEGAE